MKKRILLQASLFPPLLAGILFVSAGTLAYWQAWAYCLVLTALFFTTILYFLKRDPGLVERRSHRKEKRPTQQILMLILQVLYYGSFVLAGLDRRYHWSVVPVAVAVAGLIGFLCGYGGIILVMKENTFAASTIEIAKGQKVITTGPYRFVRHPMYTGGIVFFLCTPLALGSLWAFLVSLPVIPLIVLRLLDEERYLTENLPGYADYCRQTPYRLVPGVW